MTVALVVVVLVVLAVGAARGARALGIGLQPTEGLRDLLAEVIHDRVRLRLIQADTAEAQHIQKTLEDAGIKLESVAADILGAFGRAMLTALVAGERDPEGAGPAGPREAALQDPGAAPGAARPFRRAPRAADRLSLKHIEHLEGPIAELDQRVDTLFATATSETGVPFARARDRLDTIP
jgi:transposase